MLSVADFADDGVTRNADAESAFGRRGDGSVGTLTKTMPVQALRARHGDGWLRAWQCPAGSAVR
jgi:hypothetical protein